MYVEATLRVDNFGMKTNVSTPIPNTWYTKLIMGQRA